MYHPQEEDDQSTERGMKNCVDYQELGEALLDIDDRGLAWAEDLLHERRHQEGPNLDDRLLRAIDALGSVRGLTKRVRGANSDLRSFLVTTP